MAEGRFTKLETKDSLAKPLPGSIPRENPVPTKAPLPANDPTAGYSSFLQQADEAYFTGDYRTALRHYSRALQADSAQVYPWIGQLSCLLALKQFKEAELWSNRALEQFPEESSLLSQRARVLALTGNLKRAIGASDYALQKPGASEWTWLARGEVLLEAGDPNALICFEKALEIAGDRDWRLPLLAGEVFLRKRQWANAEDFLRKAVERNSQNYFAWFEYARVLMELNYTDRARDAISRVKQLNPEFRPVKDLELRLYRRPFFQRLFGSLKRR